MKQKSWFQWRFQNNHRYQERKNIAMMWRYLWLIKNARLQFRLKTADVGTKRVTRASRQTAVYDDASPRLVRLCRPSEVDVAIIVVVLSALFLIFVFAKHQITEMKYYLFSL